jgi:hypothetical protein
VKARHFHWSQQRLAFVKTSIYTQDFTRPEKHLHETIGTRDDAFAEAIIERFDEAFMWADSTTMVERLRTSKNRKCLAASAQLRRAPAILWNVSASSPAACPHARKYGQAIPDGIGRWVA